jgi:hypothetical protein
MDLIFWIKLLHTLVFFFASACIGYVVYCGVTNKTDGYLWASIAVVSLIGVAYAANGFECLLSSIIYRLAGRRDVADIFFPDWFANNIMPVSTPIFVIGTALVLRNQYFRRKANMRLH